jgi:pimeloyl-ACP methyl ester carboxylesterase
MTSPTGAYADIAGMQMYYEIHGEGFPTILLHGGIGASEMWGENIAALAHGRQVIAVHLQGHGKTKDIDRPLRYETLADDVAALAAHLGHTRVDLVGCSFGGGVVWRLAIQHPTIVRKLVVISEPSRKDAWFPAVVEQLDGMEAAAEQIGAMVQHGPMGQVHPDVNFIELFRKMGDLEKQSYDWTAEVAAITSPVMLIVADGDAFDISHYVEIYGLLGGNAADPGMDNSKRVPHRLAVVPGINHYELMGTGTIVADLVHPFLNA